MILVLGLDPGFASCGYAAMELDDDGVIDVAEMGVIRTQPSPKKRKVLAVDDNVRRLQEIVKELDGLVGGANVVCAEAMSFPRNASSSAKIGMVVGAVVTLCEAHGRVLLQATPQQIKKAVCGNKSASKEEVESAMLDKHPAIDLLLKDVPRSQVQHAYDALAAAEACLDSETVRLLRSVA